MKLFKRARGSISYKTEMEFNDLIGTTGQTCVGEWGYKLVDSADHSTQYIILYGKGKDRLGVEIERWEKKFQISYNGKRAHKDAIKLASILGGERV